MLRKLAPDRLIVVDDAPLWQRIAVFAVSVLVFVAARKLTSQLRPVLDSVVGGLPEGPRTVAQHGFVYSLLTAILCAVTWALLVKLERLRAPQFRFDREAILYGLAVGVGVSLATAALWAVIGPGFQVHVGGWKMLGDVLSNFYEEVGYRGLLFGAALYAVRRPIPAALMAGAVFGWTHDQYPLFFQVFTAFVGAAFALGYLRTGTLVTAWIAHQVTDMLLDTFLQN